MNRQPISNMGLSRFTSPQTNASSTSPAQSLPCKLHGFNLRGEFTADVTETLNNFIHKYIHDIVMSFISLLYTYEQTRRNVHNGKFNLF